MHVMMRNVQDELKLMTKPSFSINWEPSIEEETWYTASMGHVCSHLWATE
jgi:hypothetical protein